MQLYGTFFDGSQVELHVQVGSTCAALHVKDAHGVWGVVFENPLPCIVLFKFAVDICQRLAVRMTAAFIVVIEQIIETGCRAIVMNNACPEVHIAAHSAVDAAKVDDKLPVHIEPEVIVAGELEDNVVAPGIQSAGRLDKAGLQLHPEVIIRVSFDKVQLLMFARIRIAQLRRITCSLSS